MGIGQQIINGTNGLDSKPLTAYEELKAWCEKHLLKEEYRAVPETTSFEETIYFTTGYGNEVPYITFEKGRFNSLNECTIEEMFDHVNQYEKEREIVADPTPTSVDGLMVRGMMEAYENNLK